MVDSPDTLRIQLRQEGEKRREFKRLRAEAAVELAELVPAARAAGLTIAEIGRLADLTPPAVYTLLNKN
jgi:CheY-specific phosphatase CheX